jgi:ankyrin repeat protein
VAKRFNDNFRKCEDFISNLLFESKNEISRNIFDRMFAKDSEIHSSFWNNDIHILKEILKTKTDINSLDKDGRIALHLAASYNSPCIDSFCHSQVLKPSNQISSEWTPMRYAERTKSWMTMDILLQNGANPDDIVLIRPNSES